MNARDNSINREKTKPYRPLPFLFSPLPSPSSLSSFLFCASFFLGKNSLGVGEGRGRQREASVIRPATPSSSQSRTQPCKAPPWSKSRPCRRRVPGGSSSSSCCCCCYGCYYCCYCCRFDGTKSRYTGRKRKGRRRRRKERGWLRLGDLGRASSRRRVLLRPGRRRGGSWWWWGWVGSLGGFGRSRLNHCCLLVRYCRCRHWEEQYSGGKQED